MHPPHPPISSPHLLPAPHAKVIVLKGKASESETDHLTSAGSKAPPLASTVFCRLITLQSSAGAPRVVNYFAKRCGDVPRRAGLGERRRARNPKTRKSEIRKSARARAKKGDKQKHEKVKKKMKKMGGAERNVKGRGFSLRRAADVFTQTLCAAAGRPA